MKKITLFIFLQFLFLSIFSQTEITLSEAIKIGLENNYQIKIAEKRKEIASNNNTLKNTGRYPVVDFNINNNNSFSNSNNPASFIPKNNIITSGITPSIDGRWTIFDGFKFKMNKSRFEQLEIQSDAQIAIAIENNIQAIMQAYYNAQIQKEQLKVIQEILQLSKDKIEYQEIKKEFAQAGNFDVLQSQNAFLNDSTTLLIQQNTYQTALLNLKLAMGIQTDDILYQPADELNFEENKYQYKDLEEKLFSSNNNLKQLFIAQQINKINTDLQKANLYPTISLGSGISFNEGYAWQSGINPFNQESIGGNFSNNLNYYLNVSATYNIFDAGQRKRNIENANIEEEIAQLNIDDLKQSLSSRLKIILNNYNNQLQLISLTEQLIENSKQNLDIANERYKGSLISSFDYRNVQLAYINASQTRLNAIFNLKNTEIELIKIIGGLIQQ